MSEAQRAPGEGAPDLRSRLRRLEPLIPDRTHINHRQPAHVGYGLTYMAVGRLLIFAPPESAEELADLVELLRDLLRGLERGAST